MSNANFSLVETYILEEQLKKLRMNKNKQPKTLDDFAAKLIKYISLSVKHIELSYVTFSLRNSSIFVTVYVDDTYFYSKNVISNKLKARLSLPSKIISNIGVTMHSGNMSTVVCDINYNLFPELKESQEKHKVWATVSGKSSYTVTLDDRVTKQVKYTH